MVFFDNGNWVEQYEFLLILTGSQFKQNDNTVCLENKNKREKKNHGPERNIVFAFVISSFCSSSIFLDILINVFRTL